MASGAHRPSFSTFTNLGLLALVVLAAGTALLGTSPAHASVGVNDYPYASSTPDTVDSWNFYTRECTSFVAWRLNNDKGIPFTNQYGNPAPNSVAVWNPFVGGTGSAGHVAYVMSVNGDGTINVEEYNWVSFAYDQRTISPAGLSFIHF